jgi:hypothetical protein
MTSRTTIRMLKSFLAWKGNGMGDGVKGRLDNTMAMAIRRHQQYCDDNFSNGDLKAMALKTADAMQVFQSLLGTYLDNEHATLSLFK